MIRLPGLQYVLSDITCMMSLAWPTAGHHSMAAAKVCPGCQAATYAWCCHPEVTGVMAIYRYVNLLAVVVNLGKPYTAKMLSNTSQLGMTVRDDSFLTNPSCLCRCVAGSFLLMGEAVPSVGCCRGGKGGAEHCRSCVPVAEGSV